MTLGLTLVARADPAPSVAGSAAAVPARTPPVTPPPVAPAAPLPPPKLPVLVNTNDDVPIPANGSFLLDTKGAHGSATIWLEDLNGTIEGTARVFETFIVWTPSRELTPGTPYTLIVLLPGTTQRDMYAVRVAAKVEPSRPALKAALRLERVETMGKSKCCGSIPGFPPRASSCFPTETKSMVRMRGAITSPAEPTQLTQFMFRLRRAGDAGASGMLGFTPLSGIQPLLWPELEDEYCAELSALEIGSARIFEYDDLEMPCPSAEALGDLSPREIPLDAARMLDHSICTVPPPDLEDDWCDTNRLDCSSSGASVGCENWNHLCEDGPAPTPPAAITPTHPGFGTAGIGVVGEEQRPRHPPRGDAGFGCSVPQQRARSGLAAFSCGFAWLLLVVRRRRASRENHLTPLPPRRAASSNTAARPAPALP